jgi:rubrerythrin
MQEDKIMNEAERIEGFRKELATLVNRYSLESIEDGNVPDHILADVMVDAMLSFNRNHKAVHKWYGVELEPGKKRFTDSEIVERKKKAEAATGYITMPGRRYVMCGRCGSTFFDDYIKVGEKREKSCPVCDDCNNFADVPKVENEMKETIELLRNMKLDVYNIITTPKKRLHAHSERLKEDVIYNLSAIIDRLEGIKKA